MRRTMLSMESLQEEEDEEDDDSEHEDWEQEQALDAALWRSVVDEASQKTYYYHVVTRESVWDKPLALCSARERAEVARRKDQQRSFFAEMEGNIRSKISQGLLFGGATPPSIPSTPVGLAGNFTLSMAAGGATEEPSPGRGYPRQSADRLCRTISTMDDSVVVAQLCASSPQIASGTYSCSSPEAPSVFFLESGGATGPGGGGCSSPPSLAPLGPSTGRVPAASQRAPAWNKSSSAHKANDIPVLRRLEHNSGAGGDGGSDLKPTSTRAGGASEGANKGAGSAADSSSSTFSFAPAAIAAAAAAAAAAASPHRNSEGTSGQDRPRRQHRRQPSNGSASSSGSGNISAAGELAGVEDFSNGGWGGGVGPSSGGYRYGGVGATISGSGGGSGGSGGSGGDGGEGAPEHASGKGGGERGGGHRRSLPPSLVRRNSTSTIYLAAHDTLSDPDLDATIRCVCAVLRAHMIAAVADAREDREGGRGGSGGNSGKGPRDGGGGGGGGDRGVGVWDGERRSSCRRGENVKVFDDPPEVEESGATGGGSGGGGEGSSAGTVVPPLREITSFYRDLYHRTCLKFDSIVLSLIYVERLMKETKGALRPQPWNWKSLIMSALVLSSKVWDDNSMWNRDFSEVLPSFSLSRLNQLEVAVLGVLRFNVKVLSSEYAKYYFHLRAMCVKGGLSEGHAPIHPLDMEDIKELENMSSKLARDSVGQHTRSGKAKSLHRVNDAKLLRKVAKSSYAFTDRHAPTLSLEQVVSGNTQLV